MCAGVTYAVLPAAVPITLAVRGKQVKIRRRGTAPSAFFPPAAGVPEHELRAAVADDGRHRTTPIDFGNHAAQKQL
jgi:hypothetical protein